MKKLFLFLLILVFSCGKNTATDIEHIEVMAYYYHFDENQDNNLKPIFYSKIDQNGMVKTIKTDFNKNQKFYLSEMDPDLLKKIVFETKNKTEKDFEVQSDTSSIRIYCGPTIRFCITHKDGNKVSFFVDPISNPEKFKDFQTLYTTLSNDTLLVLTNNNEIEKLKNSQKEYARFSFHKDTLHLQPPSPPRPKIDAIKFTK